jgi:arabinogalactan oligomer/maltooligosaccharide transport system permease protein
MKAIKNFFADFVNGIVKGDIWTKLSLVIMGAGYFGRKQYAKAILMTLFEILYIVMFAIVCLPYLLKFDTLGDVQRETYFDINTMQETVNDFDNSLLILLMGTMGIVLLLAFVFIYISNMKAVYRLQLAQENGEHIRTFKEDVKRFANDRFHITLLTLPGLGVILFTVVPLIFMIFVAFTNYDEFHLAPSKLFTWVGIDNFINLFTTSATVTFGYTFVRVLAWTLIWAVAATFTTYIGGILLAKLINDKLTFGKKFWRTCFVITIAIPQFVTLLLIGKMFGNFGIVNGLLADTGIVEFFQGLGWINESIDYIPFLTKPGWAHVMIIIINIWIGVPYQMLVATGILMNIPSDQLESARIDGATNRQIFWKIIMPYYLFITGPSLLTSFIGNINNFNVIYLLASSGGFVTTDMQLAASNSKEIDLLITWLFTLTNDYSNFKMASVIGIVVFIICASFTLITYTRMIAGDKEEEFQ